MAKFSQNKAKAISAELLELIFKTKLEETGKTRWNGKKEKNWKKEKKLKPEETKWYWKKWEETERNRKKQEEIVKNSNKP